VNQNIACITVSAALKMAYWRGLRRWPENCNYYKSPFFFQEGGNASATLREVTVQITSDSECNSTYAGYWDFTDRKICAGDPNGGKGGCNVRGS
jgi:hypothetical protein